MVITDCSIVRSHDPAGYAWQHLQFFQNSERVAATLIQIHEIPARQRKNARKQAEQLGLCLTQARDYFKAASIVGPTTKPVLLYYGSMCLALAEVLFKQSGAYSLDAARSQHRHHGLTFSLSAKPDVRDTLAKAGSKMRCAPHMPGGSRSGTFSLWHKGAREAAICGIQTEVRRDGSYTEGFRVLMSSGIDDVPFECLPPNGYSLIDSVEALACLHSILPKFDVPSQVVRAGVVRQYISAEEKLLTEVTVHPTPEPLLTKMMGSIFVAPASVPGVEVRELINGSLLQTTDKSPFISGSVTFPQGTTWARNEVRFCPTARHLNEFGHFYAALFILGNYARYYPDYWIQDINSRSELALFSELLMHEAERRLPLLALTELDQIAYVIES